MTYQKEVGRWGEGIACDYLIACGYEIIERNFHTRYGEIDIIGSKNTILHFFEVKTRTSDKFGLPEDSISEAKQDHLLNAALLYLEQNPQFEIWQFDLITVEGKFRSPSPLITLFDNAIVE